MIADEVNLQGDSTALRSRRVMDVAMGLFAQRPVRSVRMQSIADEAGVSVGFIYTIAKSKDDLLFLVLSEVLEMYKKTLPAAMSGIDDPVERLRAGFYEYCNVIDSRRLQAVLAYSESRSVNRIFRQRLKELELATTRLLEEPIADAVSRGIFRSEPDSFHSAYNLAVLGHMWALKHWHFGPRMTCRTFAETQFEFFNHSMQNPV